MDRRRFVRSSLLVMATSPLLSAGFFTTGKTASVMTNSDDVRDYLNRMKHFDEHFSTDVFVDEAAQPLLASCVKKLKQLERIVGYSQFTVISFNYALAIARNYSQIGAFQPEEIEFLNRIFYADVERYGFLGKKTTEKIDHVIDSREIKKVVGTGHFLYTGPALDTFNTLKKELGRDLELTSGIRGVIKQMLLFLNKALKNRGNLSLASRQLAPPGYSFHAVGDLDVGKAGFGAANFTEHFMLTDVFQKLAQRGYLSLRYPQDNMLGVRYEPWHIKIVDWG